MKTIFNFNFNFKNLAVLAALATFLLLPNLGHANCTVSPASALPYNVAAAGLTSYVVISAPAGCAWTFTARDYTWIRMLSATSGSGSAVIYFQVLPNTTGRARAASFGPEGVTTSSGFGTRSNTVSGSTGFSITMTQAAH
jgi:hypothetical protein